MLDTHEELSIAVVGMSGRFPGAKGTQEFWDNLVNEKESIATLTEEELLESKIEKKLIDNPSYIKAKGVVGDSEYFDAAFFWYSPREAELLDPQHRVFLECAWHAMEDAGHDPHRTDLKIGIFGGTGVPEYHLAMSKNSEPRIPSQGMSTIISNEKDYLTTRVAYKMNLSGTSVTVQCACSTSLTAIVLGMQSLSMHQNDMVLCGGVSITYPEKQGYLYEKGSLDSPDGHCRTFDANALGTVFSSGAGVVVLKRLSDAIRDRDHIYCVLKGGSINNDGGSKSSYTAPSVEGQVAVEVDALEMAGVNPETITYVEAHGTATQIGDPIEFKGLTTSFREYTSKKGFCAIGSVKTNIGHTDVASGVIGLMKIALSMEHQMIPASLHFHTPNPEIDFENSPFYVNTQTKRWEKAPHHPRRALLNSFGVGGSNACVIVEEAPKIESEVSKKSQLLLPLSAKTSSALKEMSAHLLTYLKDNPAVDLADVAYTLQLGRTLLDHRQFVAFSSREELMNALSESPNTSPFSMVSSQKDQSIVFMFPGQGNQYFGMGRDLYKNEALFRKEVDSCCAYLESLGYEYDLKKQLFNFEGECEDPTFIHQTLITQPALFIIEYSTAKFLMSLGVHPKALVGHSIGEIVAATVAGVMSVKDALKVVVERARITQKLEKGAMLAVFAGHEEVAQWVTHPNEIAVINSPKLTVVAGPMDAIASFEKELKDKKISCKRLHTSHAFHSHMMDPSIMPLEDVISKVSLAPPQIPIMSTVTGQWMKAHEAQSPSYWAQHARKPVNFLGAAQKLISENKRLFVEVGPGNSLESAMKNCTELGDIRIIGLLGSMNTALTGDKFFYTALGKIWACGGKISFENLYKKEKRRRLPLPAYPFERQKYCLDFKEPEHKLIQEKSEKKADIGDWFYQPSWKRTPSLAETFEGTSTSTDDAWIVFDTGDKLGSHLIQELRKTSSSVLCVREGEVFKKEAASNTYQINPQNLDDYLKLFEEVKATKGSAFRVIHLWNTGRHTQEVPKVEEIEAIEQHAFYGLLLLNQALIKSNMLDKLHITFVADQVYNVMNDKLHILNSLVLGPCRVFGNEHPQVNSRLIDVTYPKNAEEIANLTRCLVLENLHSSDEIVVAYRNFSRWIPIYEAQYVPKKDLQKRSLRQNGVYVLTGGTGAIGLHLAKFIAETVEAHIVLIQRGAVLDRSEWDCWLERHPEDDQQSKKIQGIKAIEALGAHVTVLQADVASREEMQRAIESILSTHKQVHGVFHCAGVAGGGVISLKSPKHAKQVLRPKVYGALILQELLSSQNLDFFISSSSVTGVLGEQGQVDYCSANAFLDAFSNRLNSIDPGVYVSINWGPWDEVGMAVEERFRKESIYQTYEQNIKHSRLIEVSSQKKEETYEVSLDPDKEWFIGSHRLKGVPTLVGTAFFEFLAEYSKKKHPHQTLVLSDIQFISPLMFFPGVEKSLRLKLSKGLDSTDFKFVSCAKNVANNEKAQEHIQGKASFEEKISDQKMDLVALRKTLTEDPDIKKLHEDNSNSILWVGTRWSSAKRVFKGEGQWLGHLELPQIFQGEADLFTMHPALLDFATGFAASYIADSMHLPAGYEKITIFHPLEKEVFSYVRQNASEEGCISLDIDILNPQGKMLVQIQGYQLRKTAEAGESLESSIEKSEDTSDFILPQEGVEAFKRVFYQQTSPQIVISSKDFEELIKENTASLEDETEVVKETAVKHPRPQLFTPYVAPTNEIEKMVAAIWESALGIEQLGIDDNFIELGGNSLTAIQVIAQLTETFKVDFSVDAFISNPTIRTLSEFILTQLVELLDENELEDEAHTEEEQIHA